MFPQIVSFFHNIVRKVLKHSHLLAYLELFHNGEVKMSIHKTNKYYY